MEEPEGAVLHYKRYLKRFPKESDVEEVRRRVHLIEMVLKKSRQGALTIEELPQGAQIDFNGQPAPSSPKAHWRLGPGPLEIKVRSLAGEEWSQRVEIKQGEHEVLIFKAQEQPPPPQLSDSKLSTREIAGWSTLGLGILSFGAGGFFYAQALEAKDSYERSGSKTLRVSSEQERESIWEEQKGFSDDFSLWRGLSYSMFALGGVSLGTGVGLLIWEFSEGEAALLPSPQGLIFRARF